MKQRRESSGWDWWIKDKVKKIKVELIAKELGDGGGALSKTSLNWNIQVIWRRAPRALWALRAPSLWTRDNF